jgi:hypothetical protein
MAALSNAFIELPKKERGDIVRKKISGGRMSVMQCIDSGERKKEI